MAIAHVDMKTDLHIQQYSLQCVLPPHSLLTPMVSPPVYSLLIAQHYVKYDLCNTKTCCTSLRDTCKVNTFNSCPNVLQDVQDSANPKKPTPKKKQKKKQCISQLRALLFLIFNFQCSWLTFIKTFHANLTVTLSYYNSNIQ